MSTEEEVEKACDAIRAELTEALGPKPDRYEVGDFDAAAWRALEDVENALFHIWKSKQL